VAGKILVTYATKWGSTEEIANDVGAALRAAGQACDVKAVHEVEGLDGYRAVILGSPIYYGSPLSEARAFTIDHKEALAKLPKALFFVSLRMAKPTPKAVEKTVKQTKAMVERVRPVHVGLFAGAVDYANYGFVMRGVLRLIGFPQGDFRKPEVVKKWVRDILPRLEAATASSPSTPPSSTPPGRS
jgi:menaquinone-dependent protoporphyrinogen oxidase